MKRLTGRWVYLCIGGTYHGLWHEIDQSWLNRNSVNLISRRYDGVGMVTSGHIETYYRRHVIMDTDGSYLTVLARGPWPYYTLLSEVWSVLERWKREHLGIDPMKAWTNVVRGLMDDG